MFGMSPQKDNTLFIKLYTIELAQKLHLKKKAESYHYQLTVDSCLDIMTFTLACICS